MLQDDKVRLQQLLQQANSSGTATEAKVAEMQAHIDTLRLVKTHP